MSGITTSTDPGSTRVLVTGGTGYVGGHLVARLLRDGYRVRTTVRAADRAAEVRAVASAAGVDPGDRLEIAAAELTSADGWAAAVRGAEYVLHVASPFPPSAPVSDDDVIAPARDGALRVLRAARDAKVRRVVLTSSFAAVGYSRKPGDRYTEADWTDPGDDNTAYIRSKVIAERAAWDFAAGEGGGLELSVVNPTGIFGPVLSDRLSGSVGFIRAMLDGAIPALPRMYFGVVDVRDVADIQLRAMLNPRAAGQRFIATSGPAVSWAGIARLLRRELGPAAAAVPTTELTDEQLIEAAKGNPALRDAARRIGQVPVISSEKARTVLGWQPRDSDETVLDTARSLISRGLISP